MVCPGIVDTPLLDEEGRDALVASGFPLLQPEDVADGGAARGGRRRGRARRGSCSRAASRSSSASRACPGRGSPARRAWCPGCERGRAGRAAPVGGRAARRPARLADARLPRGRSRSRAGSWSSGMRPRSTRSRRTSGHIVHGGLVATILDTAMGGACWTLLEGKRRSSRPTCARSSTEPRGRERCGRTAASCIERAA